MSNIICVNQVIRWHNSQEAYTDERILWIDEEYCIAYVIDIHSSEGMPFLREISDIQDALCDGLAEELSGDPVIQPIYGENPSPQRITERDHAWNIIETMIQSENEPGIYQRKMRGSMVKNATEKFSVTHATVYKYLRRYWQRGKNKNALLPDYHKSGGIGKCKKVGEKKMGRPRKLPAETNSGINVDEDTKRIFRIAYDRFYHTQKENALATAYELMLKEFYSENHCYDNGEKHIVLLPQDQLPTLTQFRYWYQKECNIRKSLQSRKGNKKYELNHRAILGKSDSGIAGPGARYQIDATVGDVYLVSRYNRNWIIGRPVIYVVIDVFSRMVAGIYVGLEGPSWAGAMMALVNAASDKVKFCAEYGIQINTEEWPCHHIPEAILGDRGEMEGKMVETLISSLHVRIENTPPYRADWKGIVEQYFKTLNMKVKPFLPGSIASDFRQRGGRDYRLDAKLDIYQFTQIVIKCVLFHNNDHWLECYTREEMMVNDDIQPIPREIWKWGIANKSGRLRTFPENIIKLNLMPSATAAVTSMGIRFNQMYYSSETAIREMWFDTARNKGGWRVDISFDPRNMNKIYVRHTQGRGFEECFLLDPHGRYHDKCMDEIRYLHATEKRLKGEAVENVLQAKVSLISGIEQIVNEAETASVESKSLNSSNAGRIRSIRTHRKNEKYLNRRKECFDLGSENTSEKNHEQIPPTGGREEPGYLDDLEMIRRKLEERLNG